MQKLIQMIQKEIGFLEDANKNFDPPDDLRLENESHIDAYKHCIRFVECRIQQIRSSQKLSRYFTEVAKCH